jgi:hypothetical protein
VNYLHEHNQHYIVMVDPAMAYQTERENGLPYESFLRARDQGILLQKNGSIYQGVVWPGVTAFPDWLNNDTASSPSFSMLKLVWTLMVYGLVSVFGPTTHYENHADRKDLWT